MITLVSAIAALWTNSGPGAAPEDITKEVFADVAQHNYSNAAKKYVKPPAEKDFAVRASQQNHLVAVYPASISKDKAIVGYVTEEIVDGQKTKQKGLLLFALKENEWKIVTDGSTWSEEEWDDVTQKVIEYAKAIGLEQNKGTK